MKETCEYNLINVSFRQKMITHVFTKSWFHVKQKLITSQDYLEEMSLGKCLHNLLSKREDIPEAVGRRCSAKKAFLKISQNSQENTYARAHFLIKLQSGCSFIKK